MKWEDLVKCWKCGEDAQLSRYFILERGKNHIKYICGSCGHTWNIPIKVLDYED